MPTLRQLIALFEPAFLSGFTFPQWVRLLTENRWDIDARYIPRAITATLGTMGTSLLKPFEPAARLDEECEKLWQNPVFILGLPRSGTTHLFNLLAQDPQFAFPSRLDCYNPHTLLLLHRLGVHHFLGRIPSKKRFMDNVQTGWLSPEEDNIALTVLAGVGSRLTQVFQKNEGYWESFGPSGLMNGSQADRFSEALATFSKKLVFLQRARPLFKSPNHLRHIPQIKKVFPKAKFIAILRHPYRQFSSHTSMHMSDSRGWSALQKPAVISDDRRLSWISGMLRSYMLARPSIPSGHLAEIHYSELEKSPEGTLAGIYESLNLGPLPAFVVDCARASYRKNAHPELPEEVKLKIRTAYEPFAELGLFRGDS